MLSGCIYIAASKGSLGNKPSVTIHVKMIITSLVLFLEALYIVQKYISQLTCTLYEPQIYLQVIALLPIQCRSKNDSYLILTQALSGL